MLVCKCLTYHSGPLYQALKARHQWAPCSLGQMKVMPYINAKDLHEQRMDMNEVD